MNLNKKAISKLMLMIFCLSFPVSGLFPSQKVQAPEFPEFKRVEGLMAAVYSPFRDDLNRTLNDDPRLFDKYAKTLIADGVNMVLVAGTNGESISMSLKERQVLTKLWIDAGHKHSMRVFIHVGANCVGDARKLAAHAESLGADGIVSMPTVYFKPQSVEALVDTMATIAKAAPKSPFYYYHIPEMTGVKFKMIDFLKTATRSKKIPNLVGIKFTCLNLQDYFECVEYQNGRYDMLYGKDEMLLGALAMGARGAIGSNYNLNGKNMNLLVKAFREGNMQKARKILSVECQLADLQDVTYHGYKAGKAIMEMKGVNVGPPRLPYFILSKEQKEKIKKAVDKMGILK